MSGDQAIGGGARQAVAPGTRHGCIRYGIFMNLNRVIQGGLSASQVSISAIKTMAPVF